MLGELQPGVALRAVDRTSAIEPGSHLRATRAARVAAAHGERGRKDSLLAIYSTILQIVADLRPLLEHIRRQDPDLERQLRRALISIPLNCAEGSSSRGRNRAARYHRSAGSMREKIAALEVAAALGYVRDVDPALRNEMQRVVFTQMKNTRH